jgi:hypothetical protein
MYNKVKPKKIAPPSFNKNQTASSYRGISVNFCSNRFIHLQGYYTFAAKPIPIDTAFCTGGYSQ